jgi:hypothetical protein
MQNWKRHASETFLGHVPPNITPSYHVIDWSWSWRWKLKLKFFVIPAAAGRPSGGVTFENSQLSHRDELSRVPSIGGEHISRKTPPSGNTSLYDSLLSSSTTISTIKHDFNLALYAGLQWARADPRGPRRPLGPRHGRCLGRTLVTVVDRRL